MAIELFKPFKPIKTGEGYGKFEFFDVDSAWKFWAAGIIDAGRKIIVQEKFDGARIVGHKKDKEVKLFTEDRKRDVSDMLPAVVEDMKKLSGDLILDGEMLVYDKDGNIMPREATMKFIAGKTPVTDFDVRWLVFDVVYEGKPVDSLSYEDRLAKLSGIVKDLKHVKLVSSITAKDERSFKRAFDSVSNMPGSEGAVVKDAGFVYTFNGRTNGMAKIKNFKEVVVKVLDKIKKAKSADTFIFVAGYKGKDGEIVKIGKTFAAKIDASIGDLLEVRVQKIIDNGDGKPFTWFHPIPVARKGTEAALFDEDDMRRIAKAGVGKASMHVFYETDDDESIVHVSALDLIDKFAVAEDGAADEFYMVKPGWSGKYVMQEHHRGKSVHTDFRMEHPGGNLMGWTLDTPGNDVSRSKIFDNKPKDRILVEKKLEQPRVWLTFEGKTKSGNESSDKLPEPGATKNYAGEFVIKDKGTYIAGISKPYFHEYFLKSTKAGTTSGRILVRKLSLKANPVDQDETPKSTKKVDSWLLWKPEDQTPYGDQKGEDIPEDQVQAWRKARSKVYKLLGKMPEAKAEMKLSIAASVVEDSEDGKWYIEGYASTSDLDRGNRIVTRQALQTAVNDLIGCTLYKNHKTDDEVGLIESTRIIEEGGATKLWIKARISHTKSEIWEQVKEGVLKYFSIGGRVVRYFWDVDDEGNRIQMITALTLHECSLTGIPANPNAELLTWYATNSATEEEDVMAVETGENVLENQESTDTATQETAATENQEATAADGTGTEAQAAVAEPVEGTETQEAEASSPSAEEQGSATAGTETAGQAEAEDWKGKYEQAAAALAELTGKYDSHVAADLATSRLNECDELGFDFSAERRQALVEKFKTMDEAAYDEFAGELLEAKYSYAAIPKEVQDLMKSIKEANPDWSFGKIMKEAWKQYKKTAKAEEAELAIANDMKAVDQFIKLLKAAVKAAPDAGIDECIKVAKSKMKSYPEPAGDDKPKPAKADDTTTDPVAALDETTATPEPANAAADPAAALEALAEGGAGQEAALNVEADPTSKESPWGKFWSKF